MAKFWAGVLCPGPGIHDFHEPQVMMRGLLRAARRGHHSGIGSRKGLHPVAQSSTPPKEFDMTQWTKPQATDLRYGFEITMYISNR